jgi:hypothetical protein
LDIDGSEVNLKPGNKPADIFLHQNLQASFVFRVHAGDQYAVSTVNFDLSIRVDMFQFCLCLVCPEPGIGFMADFVFQEFVGVCFAFGYDLNQNHFTILFLYAQLF